jgi:phosphoglycerol transferase MdoB-like AlkP superfamily enzyme
VVSQADKISTDSFTPICVSDYLSAAGYRCFASCTQYCSQGILYRRHKMAAIDATRHHARTDWPHWKFIQNELLPELMQKQPFYLVMHSEDTHPSFYLDPECLRRRPELKKWPSSMAAVQCSDLLIQGFMERVKELGLDKNSEVVLYGDHLLWGTNGWYEDTQKRRLLMVFANQKYGWIEKRTTWFDVAPTLLDIVGIKEYQPPFPYGEIMFSEKNGTEPQDADKVYIQNIVHVRG